MPWAIKWHDEQLIGRLFPAMRPAEPDDCGGYSIAVFATRAEARKGIQERFAYLKDGWPHGWKMPKAVRVCVILQEEP